MNIASKNASQKTKIKSRTPTRSASAAAERAMQISCSCAAFLPRTWTPASLNEECRGFRKLKAPALFFTEAVMPVFERLKPKGPARPDGCGMGDHLAVAA